MPHQNSILPSSTRRKDGREERREGGSFIVDGIKLDTSRVFDAYWQFAAERQRIFLKRVNRANTPTLSDDPIFQTYKFTNSYRASDRVSQYLIRNVIYSEKTDKSPENTFFRIMLFKIFNKIETWKYLENHLKHININAVDLGEIDALLTARYNQGHSIYAAAYIMPSAGRVFGFIRKHSNHLALIRRMLEQDFPHKLACARNMREGFEILASAPSFGPFLAYQFITDINYSALTDFSEMEFVVPGPGALDGISKCFTDTKGIPPERIIRAVADQQEQMFVERDIEFPTLWGRPLQLIDCQNLFCEISKYSRVAFPDIAGISGRKRIKQKFRPAGSMATPFYPPKWGINEVIPNGGQIIQAESATARTEQPRLI